jgi:hypothetical protein
MVRDVNFSRFSGCLIDGFILTWLKQGRGSAATFVEEEADREMDVASFLKQWNGNIFASPVVTTKIFQFWMGPYEAHPQSEQLVKTWNDLLAALSSQREQFSTSKQYYELCRQQGRNTKEFLRRWLRHRNWKGIQERWGDESTLISRIFLLWNKVGGQNNGFFVLITNYNDSPNHMSSTCLLLLWMNTFR